MSSALILGGFLLLAASWKVLFEARRTGRLGTEGPYRYVRHPPYGGFTIIMIGFLLPWPTIPTLVMFPVPAVMYTRLARREEREVAAALPEAWKRYAASTPRWLADPSPTFLEATPAHGGALREP